MQNPYESSHVAPSSEEDQPHIRISAVIVGVLADIGSTLVGGVVLGIIGVVVLGAEGANPQAMQEELESMPLIQYGGFLIGSLASVLGGYIAALLGKVWPYKHALLTGFGSMLTGIAATLAFDMDLSSVESLASIAIVFPMVLLGAYIYTLQRGPLPPDPRDVM